MSSLPQLLDPLGELVPLVTAESLLQAAGITDPASADTADLAAFIGDADHLVALAREAKGIVGDEVIRRMDLKAAWTAYAGGYKITAPSPAPSTAWDVGALRRTLAELEDEGLIGGQAVAAALITTTTYKPRDAGLKALQKLGGTVAQRIAACGESVAKTRRVTVTFKSPD